MGSEHVLSVYCLLVCLRWKGLSCSPASPQNLYVAETGFEVLVVLPPIPSSGIPYMYLRWLERLILESGHWKRIEFHPRRALVPAFCVPSPSPIFLARHSNLRSSRRTGSILNISILIPSLIYFFFWQHLVNCISLASWLVWNCLLDQASLKLAEICLSFSPAPSAGLKTYLTTMCSVFFIIVGVCVCAYVWMYAVYMHVCGGQKQASTVRSPEARITGSCELPDTGVENWTPVPWKSSKCS